MTSVVTAVLLRPLPFAEGERLVALTPVKTRDGGRETWPASFLDARDWRERLARGGAESPPVFEAVALHTFPQGARGSFNLLVEGEAERVNGEMVTRDYFRLLGAEPLHGRVFGPDEESYPGTPQVAILSHGLWRRRFGGDPAAVGRTLVLNGRGYQVIGIMPRGFDGLTREAQVWLPAAHAHELLAPGFVADRGLRWLLGVARLRPGVSLEEARQRASAAARGLSAEHPTTNRDLDLTLEPLAEAWFGDLRKPLVTLLIAALLVQLVATADASALLLARAMARRRELAVRTALGAGRGRLARLLLTESLVLTLGGALLGLLAAGVVIGPLVRSSQVEHLARLDVGIDPLTAGAVLGLSALLGLAAGLAPAFLPARGSLASILRDGTRTSSGAGRRRLRSALVVTQIAVALILAIGAGLLARGFAGYHGADLGYRRDGLLTLRVDLKGERYAGAEGMGLLARELLERFRELPGVTTFALVGPGLPTDGWSGSSFLLEDRQGSADATLFLPYHHVSAGYFRALDIPLRSGRTFRPGEGPEDPPGIVVSASLARQAWPGQEPLGQRMRLASAPAGSPWLTVIGVVEDIEHRPPVGIGSAGIEWPGPDAYVSFLQWPPVAIPTVNLLVHRDGTVPMSELIDRARAELRAIAPELPVYDIASMAERLHEQTAQGRFLVRLMLLFAVVALALAAVGLYGLMAHSVAARRRELAVRRALGESDSRLLRRLLAAGTQLAGLGLAAGLALTLALARLLESLLHGLSPYHPGIYAAAALTLFIAALAATALPARRALKVPPAEVLKGE